MQDRYYQKSDCNIVRIIRGKELPGDSEQENKYTRAARFLSTLIAEKILVQDTKEAVYPYMVSYKFQGEPRINRGFVILGRLDDFSSGNVRPHERTFEGPKYDRLRLLRATRANFGQIFMLYHDGAKTASERIFDACAGSDPAAEVTLADVTHRLWRIDHPGMINALIEEMKGAELFIADGHHRYETALNFHREMKEDGAASEIEESAWRMMTLFDMSDKNLTVLPTHRVISGIADLDLAQLTKTLEKFFDITCVNGEKLSSSTIADLIRRRSDDKRVIGLYAADGGLRVMRLRADVKLPDTVLSATNPVLFDLDVTILHSLIIEHILKIDVDKEDETGRIRYVRVSDEAQGMVENGEAQLAFFLNPTSVAQVGHIARAGEVMPQKSTDFYPKLLTGMVLRKL